MSDSPADPQPGREDAVQRSNNEKDEIARHYGFESYRELRGLSTELPIQDGDAVPTYMARKSNGDWFIWRDELPPRNPCNP